MNKLFKKTVTLLSCTILICETMLTNVVGAIEELLAMDPDVEVTNETATNLKDESLGKETLDLSITPTIAGLGNSTSNNNPDDKGTNESSTGTNLSDSTNQVFTGTNSETGGDNDDNGGDDNNNDSNNGSGNISNNERIQCDADVKSSFLNNLTQLINDSMKDSNYTGFKSAEASLENDTLILYIENENIELPDLSAYITGLVDHILWKENRDKAERRFWDSLSIRNQGLELTVTEVMGLVDINLGKTNKINVNFEDCYFTLNIELKVDDSNSGGNNNEETLCTKDAKANLINTLSEMVNDIIKNSNNTGFKRAEASTDNDTLILYVENENIKIPGLNSYILALTDYIVGKNLDKAEVKFWAELASKNRGLLLTVTSVMNLVNFNIGNRDHIIVNFYNCTFPLYIELKVDDSSSNGNNNGNNGNGYSGGGVSRGGGNGGSSSNNSSKSVDSNDEEIALSGEVTDDTDDKMEVKKSETCSIEGSTFSEEENQAYLWACEQGIVIADNIMKADMKRNLTRAELAKMLSVYSEELLGRTRVKNESVTYPDVSDKLGDLAYYIQEGYKLQIMGIHADGTALSKFSPSSSVTRGEFGTVFSRVLHGNKYNIGNSHYYEKHLEVLKDEGILTNTNPKLTEKRGWILLMLYRSQKIEASNGNISNEEIANITNENKEETEG